MCISSGNYYESVKSNKYVSCHLSGGKFMTPSVVKNASYKVESIVDTIFDLNTLVSFARDVLSSCKPFLTL
jgi:hypothetical protein